MRTSIPLFTALIAAGITGCVNYDSRGDGEDPAAGDYDSTADDLGDTLDDLLIGFEPFQAEAGEKFLGYIQVQQGDLDLSTIDELNFYGDLVVETWDIRGDEIILSASVPDDAVEGEVDLVVVIDQADAIWLNNAITIYPTGSGNSAEDGYGSPDDATDCE